MPLLLSIVGWVFVAVGVVAWIGFLMEKPPMPAFGTRETLRFPSAIQETPIFLAIGFGFVLVAAGAILRSLDQLNDAMRASSRAPHADTSPGAALPDVATPAPELQPLSVRRGDFPADIARMVSRLEQAGWSIEPGQAGAWQASRRGHVQQFSSLDEFRDWLSARAT